jgi:hypothetical protein
VIYLSFINQEENKRARHSFYITFGIEGNSGLYFPQKRNIKLLKNYPGNAFHSFFMLLFIVCTNPTQKEVFAKKKNIYLGC